MAKMTAKQAADELVEAINDVADRWCGDPEEEAPWIALADVAGPVAARDDSGKIVSYRIMLGSDIEVIVR